MSYETRLRDLPIARANILMVQQVNSGRVLMPVGAQEFDCLVMRFAGTRTAHHPPAGIEYTAIAVLEENILDVIQMLVMNARTFFPDQMHGVELISENNSSEPVSEPEDQPALDTTSQGL
ncbi:hypothetical protein [Nocardia brasiliensis]|uniref:hypothetical protein n=1 Tax=Nocardia brasiliensis TaxID=37326 RepID=UPI0018937BF7|nr:hypothetical protein [Nocardia brasiliensis]MBF6545301.1 hypothetical protein [Nocardia brasiliensis]